MAAHSHRDKISRDDLHEEDHYGFYVNKLIFSIWRTTDEARSVKYSSNYRGLQFSHIFTYFLFLLCASDVDRISDVLLLLLFSHIPDLGGSNFPKRIIETHRQLIGVCGRWAFFMSAVWTYIKRHPWKRINKNTWCRRVPKYTWNWKLWRKAWRGRLI